MEHYHKTFWEKDNFFDFLDDKERICKCLNCELDQKFCDGACMPGTKIKKGAWDKDYAIELYMKGAKIADIAKAVNRSNNTIELLLRKNNINRRKAKTSDSDGFKQIKVEEKSITLKDTLCWTCTAPGTGRCSWDDSKGNVPVEGWVAEKQVINMQSIGLVDTYLVIECPLYEKCRNIDKHQARLI